MYPFRREIALFLESKSEAPNVPIQTQISSLILSEALLYFFLHTELNFHPVADPTDEMFIRDVIIYTKTLQRTELLGNHYFSYLRHLGFIKVWPLGF